MKDLYFFFSLFKVFFNIQQKYAKKLMLLWICEICKTFINSDACTPFGKGYNY